jgi:hypothetical protein
MGLRWESLGKQRDVVRGNALLAVVYLLFGYYEP